jgi:hypothetical protein
MGRGRRRRALDRGRPAVGDESVEPGPLGGGIGLADVPFQFLMSTSAWATFSLACRHDVVAGVAGSVIRLMASSRNASFSFIRSSSFVSPVKT